MSTLTELDISPAELEELFNSPAFEKDRGWRIIAHNDDVTSFDFVILVFMRVFGLSEERAFELAYKIHNEGQAEIDKGSREDLEKKQLMVFQFNLKYGESLLTTIEKID